PNKMTPEQEKKAVSLLKDETVGSLRKVRKRLRMEEKVDVTIETIRTTAKKQRVRPVKEQKKPKLTDAQKEARLAFASTSRRQGYWNRVLFTDECVFPVFGPPIIRWIDEDDEVPIRETV